MKRILEDGYHGSKFILDPQDDYPNHYLQMDNDLAQINQASQKFQDDVDRGSKGVIGARYLVSNPQYSWYWSLTDDIYMDLDLVTKFFEELERKYDPYSQIVIKGQCLCNHGYRYLQGGAGYIFSNLAAKKFNEISINWLQTMTQFDDLHFKDVLDAFNLTTDDIAINNIFGYRAGDILKYPNFQKCPSNISKTCCGYDSIYPMNKLMVIHENYMNVMEVAVLFVSQIKQKNESLYHYYYGDPWELTPCKL
ncbi:hypothetical protein TVAG_458440 [Trichomonas vaginalis G3]|uniref:Uncharacterized protein n=1 Tax=Trichomonas vaginalis (strain ATCC PRA-98 / G3) TaxID=412133 RepID=A2FN09_TRIV3|nr:hypothetical protein TVAGG3_0634020 [Trichomonas vaginalis G3]EAX93707.1 hypothetical protein TVAG_458440 [Trichomonas vaginalis G3]KAI5504733.1 hypothetical protein TVAGG3_0634020 [Trichomonas vaginalis G3]|eukprot:XP_001306637.1 hypothetical protein [Trichomonas vaginalis G3]